MLSAILWSYVLSSLFGFVVFSVDHWRILTEAIIANHQIPVPFIFSILGSLLVFITLVLSDPLRALPWVNFDKDKASWANLIDLFKMKPGFSKRHGIVLGRYRYIIGFSKLLVTDASLSTLVVAPAGTGKTTGVVIPSILSSDDASLIINDPKSELYDLTVDHRRNLGPVYRIQWSDGVKHSNRWNPVSLENLPLDDEQIESYVDRLTAIIFSGEKIDFWVNNARIMFSVVLLFLIYSRKIEKKSATIFEVAEWIAELEIPGEDQPGKGQKNKLHHSAELASIFNFPARIRLHLLSLAEMDPRTRSGIIGHVQGKLMLFCNSSVRDITASSDFCLNDLRGVDGKPITIYFNVPAFDQDSFGILTGIFIEAATQTLTLEHNSNKKQMPVRMILDEVAFLPPIKSVSLGPAITRSFNVSFMSVCQNYEQIREKWGNSGLESLTSNAAFLVILTQNSFETADKLAKHIGRGAVKKGSVSRTFSLKREKSISESNEYLSFIDPQAIMNLRFGKQIVIVQSYPNRPINANSPHHWKERRFKKLVSNRKN